MGEIIRVPAFNKDDSDWILSGGSPEVISFRMQAMVANWVAYQELGTLVVGVDDEDNLIIDSKLAAKLLPKLADNQNHVFDAITERMAHV